MITGTWLSGQSFLSDCILASASLNRRHITSEYACLQFSLNVNEALVANEEDRSTNRITNCFMENDSLFSLLLYKNPKFYKRFSMNEIKKPDTEIPGLQIFINQFTALNQPVLYLPGFVRKIHKL